MSNGQPCDQEQIQTKKNTALAGSNATYTSQCVGTYPYGEFTTSSYMELSDVAGPIKDYNNSSSLVPIPNSDNIFTVSNGSYAQIYKFNYNVPTNVTATLGTGSNAGKVSYQIKSAPSNPVADAAGHTQQLNYNVMGFSNNGNYMVIDDPWTSLLSVNTSNGVITPFASAFTYSGGNYNNVGTVTSSDDGQFAALAGQGRFKLYDLNTCSSTPSTISGPDSCSSVDLSSYIPSGDPIMQVSFIDDNDLAVYAKTSSSPIKYGEYIITSYGHSFSNNQYTAMGDSYSSGEGSFDYVLGTDVSDNKCHLSSKSYPYLMAESQGYTNFNSIACSGATTPTFKNTAQFSTLPTPNALGNLTPGSQSQTQLLKLTGHPGIITIGMGGNDIGFKQIVRSCVTPFTLDSTCYDSYDSRMKLINNIDGEYTKLVSDFNQVKDQDPSAQIYAIGYPQIINTSGSCGDNVRLNSTEANMANELATDLNYTVQQAAIAAGIEYVDVSSAFSGHELCDGSKSNSAVNGLTIGQEDFLHMVGAESYHPTPLGQTLLKTAILSATSNFSSGSYSPGNPSSTTPPTPASTAAQGLLGPYTTTDSNTIAYPVYTQDIPETAYKSTGLAFTINHDDAGLVPSTSYAVSLDNGATSLGSFTSDSSGNLSVSATIPSTVADAIHTVDVVGTNSSGETVDVSQTTAVGESSGSFNGTTDSTSTCVIDTGTVQDVDQNGVDDYCQATIGRSPTDVSNLYSAHQGVAANGEDPSKIYLERNVSLASSLLGVTDYDPTSSGWALVGVASTDQTGTLANSKTNDVGLTVNTYDEYVPTVSIRSNLHGCMQITPASLAAVTSTSATTMNTVATNTSTCRTAAASADTDSDGIPDNQDMIYRFRQGDTSLGESSTDQFVERNVNASEAALGITDYSDNSNGWGKIAKFSSGYTFAKIGLLDLSTNTIIASGSSAAFTSTILSTYTQTQLQGIVPVVAMTDGTNCYNYEPDSLAFVAAGATRTASELSTNVLSCN